MPQPEIFDDKTPQVLPFILSHLTPHQQSHPNTPFIIALNGVQGAGKTVLVSTLLNTLTSPPYSLNTVVFSLDDFYLDHTSQLTLAQSHPTNPLLQHRGQPGTHDIPLLSRVFSDLKSNKPTSIPQYNKSLFSGQGDRLPPTEWHSVNTSPNKPIEIIIFEGWCVGFQPLSPSTLTSKHSTAVTQSQSATSNYTGRLGHNTLSSLQTINDSLTSYVPIWEYFDLFIHIDALDPLYVYQWRLEQEATTKRDKGAGMTDEEVKKFVDGYYPSYELYTETLRRGVFKPAEGEEVSEEKWKGRQLRLVVGEDRKVREVITI
jgi:D-glycerate 3-kinase